jgi:predicted nucleic acid-binding protein
MRGELAAFVDSSVLIYAVAADRPAQQKKAREIVERGFIEGCYAVSTQVLQETYLSLRRAATPLGHMAALDYVRSFLQWHVVEADSDLVLAALGLADREGISPWDAGILEAARRADCTRVLTEALAPGHTYEGIKVENPF